MMVDNKKIRQKDVEKVDKEYVNNGAESVTEKEVGGRNGLEPTRYGDWEKNGIISDF
jgi:hypothetical protein